MNAPITRPQERPLRQVENVRELLAHGGAKSQLASIAAKHMSPDRMMKVVANAMRTTPKLADCDPMSMLGALMTCASMGLEPNTVLGHAYLVPFKNGRKKITEVQVIVGYKGLIDLARRSGHITSISGGIHYSDDDLWDYEEGTEARLRHRPGNLEGDKLHAYAIAKFTDGGHAYVVLPWAHVMRIRDASQNWQTAVRYGNQQKSPWYVHEDEMAKKTAIRALSKYLPLSVEMTVAQEVDDAKADYAAFALNPELGEAPIIEGESTEVDDDGPIDEEDAPKPKAEHKPKAAPKNREKPAAKKEEQPKADPPADDDTGADSSGVPAVDGEMPDHLQGLMNSIKSNLTDCTTVAQIDSYIDLFKENISAARDQSPQFSADLDDEIEAFKEALKEAE